MVHAAAGDVPVGHGVLLQGALLGAQTAGVGFGGAHHRRAPDDTYHQQGKGGKNDANDASAICEAASRPTMRYVAVKTVDQQSVLSVHFTNLTPRMCIASLMVPTNPFSRQFKAVELLFLTAGPR